MKHEPFLTWAGGKRRLIPTFDTLLPKKLTTYWEPFLGSGTLFFHLADKKRIKKAYLSDLNAELIDCYAALKSGVETIIPLLKEHRNKHQDNKYFYQVRAEDPASLNPWEAAARFIYLNQTGYNGLFRVNKQGKYNTAKGRKMTSKVYNKSNLRWVNKILSLATLQAGDYFNIVAPSKNDFIYCDPPYDGTLDSYQSSGFNWNDQIELYTSILEWRKAGANIMISNSNTSRIRKLYHDFKVYEVQTTRSFHSEVEKRGKITELVFTSY